MLNDDIDTSKMKFQTEQVEIEQGWKVEDEYLLASISFQSETVTKRGLKPWIEIKRTAELWDGGYITLDHPGEDGNDIIQKPSDVIGRIQDIEIDWDNRKLDGIGKIPLENPDHTNHTDEEWDQVIQDAKERDKISVGYFFIPEQEQGTFERNGEEMEYEFVRTNMLPDHIALIESDPACSRSQGCGIDLENIQMEMENLGTEEIMGEHSPPIIEDETWDGDEAEQEIRQWAGDGSTEKEDIEWSRYFQGFLYRDEENKEDFTAYKMPHHRIRNGELVTSLQGVLTAGGVLEGARGGVDIPEDEMAEARMHLSNHYQQFDRVPPWQEEDQEENIMEKAISKIKQGLRLLKNDSNEKEQETMENSEDEKPLCDKREENDIGKEQDDQIDEIKSDLQELRKEKQELEKQLDEYRKQERERLEESVQEKTDLSDEEISEMECKDLKLILKGSERSKIPQTDEGSGNETESGMNLNSEPGMNDSELENKTIPDMYWKHQEDK